MREIIEPESERHTPVMLTILVASIGVGVWRTAYETV
jgi:hypothetical protein